MTPTSKAQKLEELFTELEPIRAELNALLYGADNKLRWDTTPEEDARIDELAAQSDEIARRITATTDAEEAHPDQAEKIIDLLKEIETRIPHTPKYEDTMANTIPTTGNPVVTTVYANVGASVSSEGFFRFTLDGVEFGPNFLGSWDQLNAVHTDLGILECKHRAYVGGEEAYNLEWPEEEFGPHPITNTWGRGDSVAEVYSDAALFLAGYHASKEG